MMEEELRYEAIHHKIVREEDYDLLTQLSNHKLDPNKPWKPSAAGSASEFSTWFPLGEYYVKWSNGKPKGVSTIFVLVNTKKRSVKRVVNMEEFLDDMFGE